MKRKLKNESGSVLVFLSVSLLALVGFAALSIDTGYSYFNRLKIQKASDSASLLGVLEVQKTTPQVISKAQEMFTANSVSTSSIHSVQCGVYNVSNNIFNPCSINLVTIDKESCNSCSNPTVNAVRVIAKETLPSLFSSVFGITGIPTTVSSIAMARFSNSSGCVRPFGIESIALNNVSTGSNFTVGTNSPGNWGKLQIGPDDLGGNRFEPAMLTGVCDPSVVVNSKVDQITGNAQQTGNIFQNIQAAGFSEKMFVPVTTLFGNGKKSVTILSFAQISLVSVNNTHGNNFSVTFKLDAINVTPPVSGGTGVPVRRYLKS